MKRFLNRDLMKEAGLLSLSNLLNSASNGLIIVLLNKYLDKTESGTFLYLLSIASPLFIFIAFDMRRKITLNQLDGLSLETLFSIRNTLALTGLIAFGLISLVVGEVTSVFLLALILIGVGKVFDSVSEINYAIFQYHGAEWAVFASRLLKFLTCLIVFVILPNQGYAAIFSLFAVSNLVPFLGFEIWLVRRFCPNLAPFRFSCVGLISNNLYGSI